MHKWSMKCSMARRTRGLILDGGSLHVWLHIKISNSSSTNHGWKHVNRIFPFFLFTEIVVLFLYVDRRAVVHPLKDWKIIGNIHDVHSHWDWEIWKHICVIPSCCNNNVKKWQQGRYSIICMCPCFMEDIKQESRLIIVFIQSLYLGKMHCMIYF